MNFLTRIKFSIGRKIAMGYLFIIVFAIINAFVVSYYLKKAKNIDTDIVEVYSPVIQKLNEYKASLDNSKKLSSILVNQPSQANVDELTKLHDDVLIVQGKSLKEYKTKLPKDVQSSFNSLFISVEELLGLEKEIKKTLSNFDNDNKVDLAFSLLESADKNVMDTYEKVKIKLDILSDDLDEIMAINLSEKVSAFSALENITIILSFILLAIGVVASFLSIRSITRPISILQKVIGDLSKGKLTDVKIRERNDEIGEMALAVSELKEGLKRTSEFAKTIGDENYEANFEKLSQDDVLGESLLEMRDKLKDAKVKEFESGWVTKGLAQFSEILRSNNEELEILSVNIITNLVKYLNANQGGIFVVSEDEEPILELKGMYAYDRVKFTEKEFRLGEGLVGQCWQEGEMIYLTEIPTNYINITSGLGDAPPSCILLMPLKVNDIIYGIIEIASFEKFEKYKIELVRKLAESIASTISYVKTNIKTAYLLEESKEMTEELRSQDEEMRQNMEEMQVTQEDMMNVTNEKDRVITELKIELEELKNK